MADGVTVNFKGFDELNRGLASLGASLDTPNEYLQLVGAEMRSDTLDSFRKKADPVTGAPWPAMKSITRNARRGKGGGAKELYDTGQLAMAINAMQPVIGTGNTVTLGVQGTRRESGGNVTIGEIARIHNGMLRGPIQENLIIKPVRAKWLCIPATPEAKKYNGARDFMNKNKANGARFVFINQSRALIVMPKTKRSRKKGAGPTQVASEIHFICLKKVSIPRRRFMGVYPDLVTRFHDLVYGEVVRTLKAANTPIVEGGATL